MRTALCTAALLTISAAASAAEPTVSPKPWARPWLIVRGAFDAPHGPGGGVLGFVHDGWSAWSVNADVSHRGPFGFVYDLGLHWWPRGRRFGSTHHQLGIGIGGDFLFNTAESSGGFAALLLLASVDIHYLGRPIKQFGFVLGGKAGVGVTFEARDFGADPRPSSALDHLGFVTIQYIGVSFGSHR